MRRPVGIAERIHTEVSVVVQLAGIPAVAVLHATVLRCSENYRVIRPFPHQTAAEPVVRHEQTYIIRQVSGTVAHGVAVLAQNERALLVRTGQKSAYIVGSGVHLRYNIYYIVGCIVKLVSALIMHGAGGIELFHQHCRVTEVIAVAALISQRPENNAGAVDVARDKKPLTVKNGSMEQRVLGYERDAAVAVGVVP